MPQTYAVVYVENGDFIIAKKNELGYFFQSQTGGDIYPNGFPIRNGPGLSALPGGSFPNGTDPAIGAGNEFWEETGVQLRSFEQKVQSVQFLDRGHYYYGVYYKLSQNDFFSVFNHASNSIQIANQLVASDIQTGIITNYSQISRLYPRCPLDNELASCQIWNLYRDWSEIQALNYNQSTNWFFEILDYLKNNFNTIN